MQLFCLEPNRRIAKVVAFGVVADGLEIVFDVWQSGVRVLIELLLYLFECHRTFDNLVVIGIFLGVGKLEEEFVERCAIGRIDGLDDGVHKLLTVLRHLLDG